MPPIAVKPLGVILAGGRATRMGGGDKGLLNLDGRPLLAHVIDGLTPQCETIALNANGPPERFAGFGLPVLPDVCPGQPGPLAGIFTAMEWAAGLGHDTVLTTPADTPFLPETLVERLEQAGAPAVAASLNGAGTQRSHPTTALWPVTLRAELRRTLEIGERRVGRFAARVGAKSVLFEGNTDPFFNINSPEDLAEAQQRLDEETQARSP